MGTNYYCDTEPWWAFWREVERKHIGKSSAGWVFALHVYPEEGINTLADWRRFWRGKRITNEYGERIAHAKMLKWITDRGRNTGWEKVPYGYRSWAEFHAMNHSEPGPSGLLRGRIDSSSHSAIAHGEGTWSYYVGEFS